MTSCDLDPARLPGRVNTVVAGILELLPGPPVRGAAGQRVPIECAAGAFVGSGAPTASAVSSAAATALAGRRSR